MLPQSIQPNFTHDDTEYIQHTTDTKKLIQLDLQNYLSLHAIEFSNDSLTTAVMLNCLSVHCTKTIATTVAMATYQTGKEATNELNSFLYVTI
jgi:DNA-directed RNA polymerase